METVSLTALFTFGLLTGLGHCAGMCGGIVIAYSSAKTDPGRSKVRQVSAHLTYNLGRATTYAALGGAVGLLGSMFAITPAMRASVLTLAGVVMVGLGLSILAQHSFLAGINTSGLSRSGAYKRLFARLLRSPSFASYYGIGLLNGLLPCGPVYAALTMTVPMASVLWGAIGMMAFGLATIPVLLALGLMVGLGHRLAYRDLFNRLAGGAVILFGVYTLYKAWRLFTRPALMLHGMDDGGACCAP